MMKMGLKDFCPRLDIAEEFAGARRLVLSENSNRSECFGDLVNAPQDLQECGRRMEPYSHAEDPDGEMYVTLTLAEALDGRELTDKCVRLLLADDEEVPYDLDCMALTYKRQTEHTEQLQTIGTADFDWRGIMEEALTHLDPEVRTYIQDRIGS